ncbi:SsgA family sporulation/cell division regulator [Streptomyces fuscichromogenes]|uniref:SsgA family sporulation/cell division regulator n=1 Tax=Streptomyces fuscichromogenes TaxID=1324013 RepID=UPI00382B48EC
MSGRVFGTDDEPGCARRGRGHRQPEPVTCRTVVALLEGEETLPVLTDLRYDSAHPYSVFVAFNAGTDMVVEWEFGRELLTSGRWRLTGLGDVQIWPAEIRGHGLVYMSFRSGGEKFVVAASAVVIDEFIESAIEAVSHGEEERFLAVDVMESFD